jgi:polyribonucleotide nucleotidyltransferase
MNISKTTINIGGTDLVLETGRYAERASAAVTARYGDTMVLCTVVMGAENLNLGYFPLFVEYQEKLFAGGRIKGSRWVKRDGRPSDEAVLKARLIDRSIRPLFEDGFLHEVQVIVTVLSADGVNDADLPGMYAVSAALALSEIPWNGPISAVRIGLNQETQALTLNPNFDDRDTSVLDLVVSGTREATIMVEAGAKEVSEAKMLEAFELAQQENARITTAITDFARKHGRTKAAFTPRIASEEMIKNIQKELKAEIPGMIEATVNLTPWSKDEYIDAVIEKYEDYSRTDVSKVIDILIKKVSREQTIKTGLRADGRKPDQIRDLSSETGLLPRTHGSAMFKRGATQALTICTLGSPSLNQLIENMEGEYSKRYIHHYAMPPYTVGETGRVGWPSRREVGHGALAERALEPVIPSEEIFPYTIHVASELMSSNGSTSMASVCGSTLSLMDAGVPITKPVAGIAMGLMVEADTHIVLSDIMGFEDHIGDMDFKVAGTVDGITALQMDIKVSGIPQDVLVKALEQARLGRLFILEHMLQTIAKPRPQISEYAPKIETITIDVERIGEVIGPGGKIIKNIIAESGAEVDINDDGHVFISSMDQEAINKARKMVEGILKEVEAGEEYEGKVVRLMDFGAFVEILPGRDGLVHVSRMSTDYVKDPAQVVAVGDEVHVWVTEIDSMGRINLSMVDPANLQQAGRREQSPRRDNFRSRPRRNH